MAFTHHIPIVSAAAGIGNDGSLIGSVSESLYAGVFTDVRIAGSVYAYTFEHVAGSSHNIGEVTVAADGTIAGSFFPFGSVAASITSQDYMIIACDNPISRIYLDIDQAGAHSGALEIHDGENFARQRTISTDGSNSLRNTGIREIVLADASAPASWSPGGTLLGITSRIWYRLRLGGSVGATAAPRVARVWVAHDSGSVTYTDLTATVNGDIAVAPAGGTFFPTLDSAVYFATVNRAIGEERYVFGAQANVRTRVMEFLTPSGWQAGTVTDPSNDLTVVPNAQPQRFSVRWTPPTTWAAAAAPFALPAGATAIPSAFWRRLRTTAVATMGPTTAARVRLRARQYGTANTTGVRVPAATSLRYATIEHIGSVLTAGNVTIELANLSTGAGASFVLASAAVLPFNVDIADIGLAADEQYGLTCIAGSGSLSDVRMILQ